MKRQIRYPATIIATIVIALVAIPALAVLGFMLRYVLLAAIPIVLLGYVLAYAVSPWVGKVFSQEALDRSMLNGFKVPKGVLFHPFHSWVKLESPKKAAIGVDDFVQKVLGPLEAIDTPPVGTRIQREENLFQLRRGDRTVDIKSPIAGTVCSVNDKLSRYPTLVNQFPYGKGWIVKLRPDNLSDDIRNLRVANEALKWFREELERFQSLLSPRPLQVQILQDGGTVVDDLWAYLDNDTWLSIKKNFFNNAS
ncbi:MAG: hypothetical protein A3G93_09315 [Nitrospinae bacterium RIFCSPLOWO2_12_FULL_45_22]|nr:MAG: hypothetical protein A3G93_09315 [Nitrospinae bacterium RIFCSPLOWO2_12_FULL_45_22]